MELDWAELLFVVGVVKRGLFDVGRGELWAGMFKGIGTGLLLEVCW